MLKIKILGGGCAKCEALYKNAEAAAKELGIDYEMEKVKDPHQILAMGVVNTPALVVNDEVLVSSSVLSKEEIKTLLEKYKKE